MKLLLMIAASLTAHLAIGTAFWTPFSPRENTDVIDISLLASRENAKQVSKTVSQAKPAMPGASGATLQTWPELVSQPKMDYPSEWQKKNLSGVVKAKLKISSLGHVDDVRILQSDSSEMADLAATAMRAFRFRPASSEGKAIASEIEYSYRFVLR